MASLAGRMAAATLMQNAAASGNGSNLDVQGGLRAIFLVTTGGTVTGGNIVFERSRDGGTNWEAVPKTQNFTDADGGAVLASSQLAATAAPALVKIPFQDGPCLVRARIDSLTGTSPTVTVRGVVVGK